MNDNEPPSSVPVPGEDGQLRAQLLDLIDAARTCPGADDGDLADTLMLHVVQPLRAEVERAEGSRQAWALEAVAQEQRVEKVTDALANQLIDASEQLAAARDEVARLNRTRIAEEDWA